MPAEVPEPAEDALKGIGDQPWATGDNKLVGLNGLPLSEQQPGDLVVSEGSGRRIAGDAANALTASGEPLVGSPDGVHETLGGGQAAVLGHEVMHLGGLEPPKE